MSAVKKGWCPTMMRPMETGDGLLVRIHKNNARLTAEEARAIADCSTRYGNGHIDLTSRGNVQLRGVTQENYAPLVAELQAHGFTEEPRPAKPAVQEIPALGKTAGGIALGLPFGRMEATQLSWLAGFGTIMLTPWRVVMLPDADEELLAQAKAMGFITESDDPLRHIQACPGAPSCAAAEGETRTLARAIAPHLAGRSAHISGCAKGCASGEKTDILVVARAGVYDMAGARGCSAQDIIAKVKA